MNIISLKQLKWIKHCIYLITGILLTNLNFYPLNIFIHSMGAIGWSISGYITRDKALMTNFGLQFLYL